MWHNSSKRLIAYLIEYTPIDPTLCGGIPQQNAWFNSAQNYKPALMQFFVTHIDPSMIHHKQNGFVYQSLRAVPKSFLNYLWTRLVITLHFVIANCICMVWCNIYQCSLYARHQTYNATRQSTHNDNHAMWNICII